MKSLDRSFIDDLLSRIDIVEIINNNKKISKKEIYDFCLSLKNEN